MSAIESLSTEIVIATSPPKLLPFLSTKAMKTPLATQWAVNQLAVLGIV